MQAKGNDEVKAKTCGYFDNRRPYGFLMACYKIDAHSCG